MSSRFVMLALLLPFTVYAQRVVIEIEDGPSIGIDAATLVRIEEARSQSGPSSPSYGHGRAATEAEIAAWDTDVMPDGRGLPEGEGTTVEGARLFATQCAVCHGIDGEGNRPLGNAVVRQAEPGRNVGDYWPYATTVYDYVHRSMPFDRPGSLTSDEVYSLTAWLLFMNGVIEEDAVLDAESLPLVVMPNLNGFVPDDREESSILK